MTCFLINNQPLSSLPSTLTAVLEDRPGWRTQSQPRSVWPALKGGVQSFLTPLYPPKTCSVQKSRLWAGPGPKEAPPTLGSM